MAARKQFEMGESKCTWDKTGWSHATTTCHKEHQPSCVSEHFDNAPRNDNQMKWRNTKKIPLKVEIQLVNIDT